MTREQAAEYIKQQSPEAFLTRARKRGYVCPLCGNGSGADGDGIVKNPRDGRYYCFKCGEVRGDIFDLIGAAFGLTEFNARFDKAAEIYGVTVDSFAPIKGWTSPVRKESSPENISGDTAQNVSGDTANIPVSFPENIPGNADPLSPAADADTEDYIRKCHERLNLTDYFFTRGISGELAEKFRLGYDPAFPAGGGVFWEAVILPTSDGSFEARNTKVVPNSKKNGKNKYRKHGRTAIFNLSALFGNFSPGGMGGVRLNDFPGNGYGGNVSLNNFPKNENGKNAPLNNSSKNENRKDIPLNNIPGNRNGEAVTLNYPPENGENIPLNLPPENGADNGNGGQPVFVCEGIIDALSVMECGGAAVALGSAANRGLLLAELKKHGTSVPLVLLPDNDEAGKTALARLSEELTAAGIAFTDGSEALGEFHDPNDRLVHDRAGFFAAIKMLTERARPMSEEIAAQQEGAFNKVNAAACLSDFRAQIAKSAALPLCGTGFSTLDKAINGGLYPGLYVLGAASSVGKTTLLLQIADHGAARGRDVLFFSLEQSRFELMAKSVSRESFLYCREHHLNISLALSSLDISDGGRHGGFDDMKRLVMENAFGRYEKYAGNLFLYEGSGGMSPEDIAGEVRRFYAFRRPTCPPLVMVDYIQILSAGGGMMSDKQAMDRNITALKQLSRDYDIPLMAVSSFNRMSYSQSVSMEAFKESGAIEYGADILMGLQSRGVGQPGFDITAARARDPRETELVILKNRSGAVPGEAVRFTYYPGFNCYMEDS